ncbi:MAG: hypothetical protein Q8Q60_03155 [Candidatus Chromulinivorax sp.]|nr:hypothetical protein [Candidatus Chromulinivorax sp.]
MNHIKIIFLLFIACTQTQIFGRTQIPTSNLTVICGSMASGKSDEFIRILRRIKVAISDNVLIVKHIWDNRKLAGSEKDPSKNIASRSGSSIECIAVNNVQEIREMLKIHDYSVIGIDEAQFFNKEELLTFVREMLALKKTVIIAGLDLDFRGETFGAMGDLLARADEVIKLKAICSCCKEDRYCITQRIIDGQPAYYEDPIIMVGESTYEARCSDCHKVVPGKRASTIEMSELNVSAKAL